MGNPFFDDFPVLVTFDNQTSADQATVVAVHTLEDTGKKQYQEFVKNVLDVRSRPNTQEFSCDLQD